MKRPVYIRNIDETFNNERLIKNTLEVNKIPWLAYHNSEID